MAIRSLIHQLHGWTLRHPWLTVLAFVIVGSLAIWLLPPRTGLGTAIMEVALMTAAILGLNLLIYRSFFPSEQKIREERRKADEIEASVRRLRDLDSRL